MASNFHVIEQWNRANVGLPRKLLATGVQKVAMTFWPKKCVCCQAATTEQEQFDNLLTLYTEHDGTLTIPYLSQFASVAYAMGKRELPIALQIHHSVFCVMPVAKQYRENREKSRSR